jgi:hypothetical protein
MKPEYSSGLPHWQEPTTCPYPEAYECSPHPRTKIMYVFLFSQALYASPSCFDIFSCHSDASSRLLYIAVEFVAEFLGLWYKRLQLLRHSAVCLACLSFNIQTLLGQTLWHWCTLLEASITTGDVTQGPLCRRRRAENTILKIVAFKLE